MVMSTRTPERLAELRSDRINRVSVRKRVATAYLGGKCVVCGTTENLEFDHIDPATKISSIADAYNRMTELKFWAEVEKCQLLCHDHHREKTILNGEVRGHRRKMI